MERASKAGKLTSARQAHLLALACATALTAGCAHLGRDSGAPGGGDKPMVRNNEPVKVMVATTPQQGWTCDPRAAANAPRICIDREETIKLRGNGTMHVTWTLATPGYAFDRTDGVDVKPKKEIHKKDAGGDTRYVWWFKDRDGDTYKYTITLVGTPAVPPWDPFIAN